MCIVLLHITTNIWFDILQWVWMFEYMFHYKMCILFHRVSLCLLACTWVSHLMACILLLRSRQRHTNWRASSDLIQDSSILTRKIECNTAHYFNNIIQQFIQLLGQKHTDVFSHAKKKNPDSMLSKSNQSSTCHYKITEGILMQLPLRIISQYC